MYILFYLQIALSSTHGVAEPSLWTKSEKWTKSVYGPSPKKSHLILSYILIEQYTVESLVNSNTNGRPKFVSIIRKFVLRCSY